MPAKRTLKKTFLFLTIIIPLLGLVWMWKSLKSEHQDFSSDNTAETSAETDVVKSIPKIPPGIDHYQHINGQLPTTLRKKFSGTAGILVDPARELILWADNDRDIVPIASMTKMMTVLLAVDIIASDPRWDYLSLTRISPATANVGGSQVWLKPGYEYTLESLMKAAMVKSANDACEALAEALAPHGNVKEFIVMMNREARLLGLKNARFYNVHGLPGKTAKTDNQATCRDMAALALIILKHADIMAWSQLKKAAFVHDSTSTIKMVNHNRLLFSCQGVKGIKTGYIRRAGFCVTAVCERDGRQLIAVATGFPTKNEREAFVSSLFDWGFEQ